MIKMAAVLPVVLASVLFLGLAGNSLAVQTAPEVQADRKVSIGGGLIDLADVEALEEDVATLLRRKQELDSQLGVDFGRHEGAAIRIAESKKSIRIELDEVLDSGASRTRLDAMFERHEDLIGEEKELAAALVATQDALASQQLLLAQKRRDLERMQSRYAAQQREEALRKVQEVARHLERSLSFRETISFKCPSSKSLGACLNEYPLEAQIQAWIGEHYENELNRDLQKLTGPVRLSSDWYTTKVNREFADASMSLQGTVAADVDVQVQVKPRKMMACALLAAPAEFCETQSVSLIVRSNKFGDQVLVNQKPYGPTPLSLMLDPGVYNIEVRYQGLTQKRTLNLDENRHINFVF